MADQNINDGAPILARRAGKVRIVDGTSGGSDEAIILLVEAGSVSYTEGRRAPIQVYNGSELTADVLIADEEVGTLRFSVNPTKNGFTATDSLRVAVAPADTGGTKTLREIQLEIPDSATASTGVLLTFNNCYLSSAPQFQSGGRGENLDSLTFEFAFADSDGPVQATY